MRAVWRPCEGPVQGICEFSIRWRSRIKSLRANDRFGACRRAAMAWIFRRTPTLPWTGLHLVRSGWNVDVDAGPDPDLRRHASDGALRLATHVVRRQTFLRNAVERLFTAVVLHAVGELERLFQAEIREKRSVDVADVLR